MEPPIYARHAVDARFVGHPMADEIPMEPDRPSARAALGFQLHDAPTLAVLPGSRLGEIAGWHRSSSKRLEGWPRRSPDCRSSSRQRMPPAAGHWKRRSPRKVDSTWHLLDGRAREAMIASDVVLLASGTATLEAMLCKWPMVVGYRIAPLTYRIVKGLAC